VKQSGAHHPRNPDSTTRQTRDKEKLDTGAKVRISRNASTHRRERSHELTPQGNDTYRSTSIRTVSQHEVQEGQKLRVMRLTIKTPANRKGNDWSGEEQNSQSNVRAPMVKYRERQGVIHGKRKRTVQKTCTTNTAVNEEGDNTGAGPGS
jgi:hypothetical protein